MHSSFANDAKGFKALVKWLGKQGAKTAAVCMEATNIYWEATYESGATVRKKPKMSKVGKASVRGALFLPAMSAIRFNPLMHTFAERLRSKGKSEKVIIGAVMRKLMHLAYGVLKHQTPFDPNYRQPNRHII